jgi:hypothetical protein
MIIAIAKIFLYAILATSLIAFLLVYKDHTLNLWRKVVAGVSITIILGAIFWGIAFVLGFGFGSR